MSTIPYPLLPSSFLSQNLCIAAFLKSQNPNPRYYVPKPFTPHGPNKHHPSTLTSQPPPQPNPHPLPIGNPVIGLLGPSSLSPIPKKTYRLQPYLAPHPPSLARIPPSYYVPCLSLFSISPASSPHPPPLPPSLASGHGHRRSLFAIG